MVFENKWGSNSYWPVYTGESFNLWNPDTGKYYAWADPGPVLDWLQGKRERAGGIRGNSSHREFSREYLLDRRTLPCLTPRIAFRDVTNRTNRRTVIACLLPPKIFLTHQAPYLLWPRGDHKDQAFLLGVLCSIPLDWFARRFVETHITFSVIGSFPIPRPSRDDSRWQRVVSLSGRLACPDDRFADWAKSVGVSCGPLLADQRDDMIHEIDAVVAHLYRLSEPKLVHVFETFHKGWNYQGRLDAVLRHYRSWVGKQ